MRAENKKKQKNKIPVQPGVLKLLVHYFHLYQVYLEHHDYHKYKQSHLCPTWLIGSIRTEAEHNII